MMATSFVVLAVPYIFVSYFAMHRSSHLAYLSADPTITLNPIIVLLMRIEQICGLIFLIWYGYMTVWYKPILLIAIGFLGTFIIKGIEHALKLHRVAWAISIIGVLVIPFLLWFMVWQVRSTT